MRPKTTPDRSATTVSASGGPGRRVVASPMSQASARPSLTTGLVRPRTLSAWARPMSRASIRRSAGPAGARLRRLRHDPSRAPPVDPVVARDPPVHHRHPSIGDAGGKPLVVRRGQDRGALGDLLIEDRGQGLPAVPVLAERRLVEDEEPTAVARAPSRARGAAARRRTAGTGSALRTRRAAGRGAP